MQTKYVINGVIKERATDNWTKMDNLRFPIGDYDVIRAMLEKSGYNWYIFEAKEVKE